MLSLAHYALSCSHLGYTCAIHPCSVNSDRSVSRLTFFFGSFSGLCFSLSDLDRYRGVMDLLSDMLKAVNPSDREVYVLLNLDPSMIL